MERQRRKNLTCKFRYSREMQIDFFFIQNDCISEYGQRPFFLLEFKSILKCKTLFNVRNFAKKVNGIEFLILMSEH